MGSQQFDFGESLVFPSKLLQMPAKTLAPPAQLPTLWLTLLTHSCLSEYCESYKPVVAEAHNKITHTRTHTQRLKDVEGVFLTGAGFPSEVILEADVEIWIILCCISCHMPHSSILDEQVQIFMGTPLS